MKKNINFLFIKYTALKLERIVENNAFICRPFKLLVWSYNLEREKVIVRTSTSGEGISLSEWSCTAHQHLLECVRCTKGK